MPTFPYRVDFDGSATIESYVVSVAASGPESTTFSAKTAAGERVFGKSQDPDLMESLLADVDVCGHEAEVSGGLVKVR